MLIIRKVKITDIIMLHKNTSLVIIQHHNYGTEEENVIIFRV